MSLLQKGRGVDGLGGIAVDKLIKYHEARGQNSLPSKREALSASVLIISI